MMGSPWTTLICTSNAVCTTTLDLRSKRCSRQGRFDLFYEQQKLFRCGDPWMT